MTDLQAALGLSQLQRLNSIVVERQRLLEQYRQMLDGLRFNCWRFLRTLDRPFTLL